MVNYLVPFKEEKEQKYFSRCVETVNNVCIKHNAIVLYVSHLTAYLENDMLSYLNK